MASVASQSLKEREEHRVDIITVSECTYAVVASWADNGVQLLNVTDPSVPAPVDAVTDGERGFTELLGAIAVAQQDNGVQLINLVCFSSHAYHGRALSSFPGHRQRL